MVYSYNAVRGCRWVDEVIENVPYITRFDVTRGHDIGADRVTYILMIIADRITLDFVVHGDDIVLVSDPLIK